MPLVETQRRDRVLIITLNRPSKRNAVNSEITLALDTALNELEDDSDLWVGAFTGAGGTFCAGTDLREGVSPSTDRGGEYRLVRRRREKLLIAAVEGAALGGGMGIVLSCDLVVAAHDASFGLPEVKRGVIATCADLSKGILAFFERRPPRWQAR